MDFSLNDWDWKAKGSGFDRVIRQERELSVHSMNQGYEAEVAKVTGPEESYVIKIWNRHYRTDTGFQFALLQALHERGLPVSEPLAWGVRADGTESLLASFDGQPVLQLDPDKMNLLAKILSDIHRTDAESLRGCGINVPSYDFMAYYFEGIENHPDLQKLLDPLIEKHPFLHKCLIHGDFHPLNLVEKEGRVTVIDWTTVQWGDSRYDFAWSLFLKKVYLPEPFAELFCTAYLEQNRIPQEELNAFEAMAFSRWMLLYRKQEVPEEPDTISNVQAVMSHNPHLRALQFQEFTEDADLKTK
ncbi:aminoglycoside phosphotransferase family protein [Paenibacillus sp. GCM10027627]|uniref:aminoglycoside phosphotransferase family protein n=1 Tax=unclassified Paenibacillus TaxID=185978 RepID=UPI00364242A9